MEKILTCIKKHCFTICFLLLASGSSFAQSLSLGINYQAIARDSATGLPFADTMINVQFSVWDALSNGNMDYSEEHLNIPTNKYGLFTLVIGTGTPITSTFNAITWAEENKYLEVKIALSGNGTYVTMPNRYRFEAVPYAHTAKTSIDGWHLKGNSLSSSDTSFIGTTTAESLVIRTNNLPRLVVGPLGNAVLTTGNLGVGVAIPNSAITISSNGVGNELEFSSSNNNDSADIISNSPINIGTTNNNPIVLKTNSGAKVIIDTLGNVGIGTQTPTAKLSVNGTVRIADTLTVQDPIRIADGTQGLGKILTSDANGLAHWDTLSLGNVTQVTADSLLPLFTTQVNTNTTTPHIEFTLEDAAPYTVFGNDTSVATQPKYYKPLLDSPLFENQGDTNRVLHGNAAGNLSWTKITTADIASQAVDLTSQVNGTLPIINGGTNATIVGDPGSIAYSNGTAYNFTQVGSSGQVLESTGSGAPVWSKRVLNIAGDSIIDATTIDTTTYTLSVAMNSAKRSGAVLKGDGYSNMVWKTDAAGNPAWRTDSSGVSYVMGTGLTLFGNTINSTWTASGGNIFNNTGTNVGIGTTTPVNKLDVEGGVAIGANYSGLSAAPSNGAIIQGKVGIGSQSPGAQLHVKTVNSSESAGYFENTFPSSIVNTLVATSSVNSTAATVFTTNTGTSGGALLATIFSNANNANAIQSETNGSGDALNATNTGNGRAGTFKITNANSTANTALYASSNVNTSGKAAHFELSHSSNSAPVLLAETIGSGNAIQATNNGTGRAGMFEITAATNTSDAVYITTNGSGSKGLSVSNTGQGVTNYGAYIESTGNGTGSSNIAGYFSATGGSANYAGIFANGNVGIGTSTPSSPLTMQTKVGTELEFVSTGTNADIIANAQFNIGSTSSSLHFLTNNSYRINIDFAGNVGVGTISPASLFHVGGAIRTGVGSGTNGSIIFNNSTNGNAVTLQTGVTSASYTLTLPTAQGATNSILANNGSGTLSWATAGSLGAWSTTGNSGTNASTNFIGTTDAVDFVAKTSNTERLRITSTGNVSIGATTNIHKFYVFGGTTLLDPNSTSSSALILKGDQSAVNHVASDGTLKWYSGLKSDNGGTADNYVIMNSTLNPNLVLTQTGNVGIGTAAPTSTVKLHMVNNVNYANELKIENPNSGTVASSMLSLYNNTSSAFINFGSSTNTTLAGNNGLAIGTVPAGKVEFYTNNTARVTIDATGNVGIGTVTPATKLQINAAGNNGNGILLYGSSTSAAAPFIEVRGRRNDNDASQSFSGGLALAGLATGAAPIHNKHVGTIYFGSNHTDGTEANLLYTASISGIAEGTFSNATTMPTGLAFYTGATGTALKTAGSTYGTERLRINNNGNVGIGTSTPVSKLDIEGGVSIGAGYSGTTGAPTNGLIVQGNVGLGLPGASNKLEVGGEVSIGTGFAGITAPSNGAIIQGNVGIGTAAPSTNSRLAIKDGHLQSQQTTAPNFSGLSVTTSNVTNSTDIAGNLVFTPSSIAAVGNLTVIFDKAYATAPIVVISPTNAAAAADLIRIYITASTTGFIVNFSAGCSATPHNFSYHVIETY